MNEFENGLEQIKTLINDTFFDWKFLLLLLAIIIVVTIISLVIKKKRR